MLKESQQSNRRLQVHYLSAEIQNKFIVCCATHVKQAILAQLKVGIHGATCRMQLE